MKASLVPHSEDVSPGATSDQRTPVMSRQLAQETEVGRERIEKIITRGSFFHCSIHNSVGPQLPSSSILQNLATDSIQKY